MADSPGESIQEKAYRLLKAIKARTENSHQPIFVADLAPDLNLNDGEVQGALGVGDDTTLTHGWDFLELT
jgi:hypothetical protein